MDDRTRPEGGLPAGRGGTTRRRFLTGAAWGAGAGAMAAGGVAGAAGTATDDAAGSAAGGHEESEHVRTFYRLSRF